MVFVANHKTKKSYLVILNRFYLENLFLVAAPTFFLRWNKPDY